MTLKWLWKLTGGRPMKFIRTEFTDAVVGRNVNSYMDRNGKFWWAFTAWDWDRMRMDGHQIMAALGGRSPAPEPTAQSKSAGASYMGGAGGAGVVTVKHIHDASANLTLATVVNSDGTSQKEWVDAGLFQEMMAEVAALLDAPVYPDVSLPDDDDRPAGVH